jgi:hypothetical protein
MKKILALFMFLLSFTALSHADQVIDDKIIQYDSFPDLTVSGLIQKAYEFNPEFNFDAPAAGAQFISSNPHLIVNNPSPVFQTFTARGLVTNNVDPLSVYDVTGFMNSTVFESNTDGIAPLLQDGFYDNAKNVQNVGIGDTTWLPISFLSRPGMEAKDGATLKTGPTVGLFRKPAFVSGVGSYVEANNYGVLMSDPIFSGTGTVNIPLNAALWVDNLVAGQDNYSVYSFGNNTKFLNEGPMMMKGSQFVKRVNVVDQNYTVTNDDYIIAFTALSANRTLTLPTPEDGRVLIIKKEMAGSRAIILNGTCDGVVNKQFAGPYDSMTIYANGSAWFSI